MRGSMANIAAIHRPFKFGAKDRREFIVQDSEVGLRCINNTDGDPIFLGRAKIGTAESEDRWQLRKISYDANGGVISVEWPQDAEGNASSDYEFVWSAVADLTITGIVTS